MSKVVRRFPTGGSAMQAASSSLLERGLAGITPGGVQATGGCHKRHKHTRHCPKKRRGKLCSLDSHKTGPCIDPKYKYEGSRNLKPWVGKTAPLPSDAYVWLRLNIFVLAWKELLFTLAVTLLWMILINEGVITIDATIFDSTAFGIIFSFAVFWVSLLLSGALGKRQANTANFVSLISASNNLMQTLEADYNHEKLLQNTLMKTRSHNGKNFVLRSIYAHEVIREIKLYLNAILFGQRNAFRSEIDDELLPLETEHIEYLKEYQATDSLIVMQGRVQSHLYDLDVAKVLKPASFENSEIEYFHELVASLGNIDIASKTKAPRLIQNLSTFLLVFLVIVMPPWFSTVYPDYWPVLWVPFVIQLLFAAVQMVRRLPNIFVSRSENIYSDVPLLQLIYDGAATNHELYCKILEQIDDIAMQRKNQEKTASGSPPSAESPQQPTPAQTANLIKFH